MKFKDEMLNIFKNKVPVRSRLENYGFIISGVDAEATYTNDPLEDAETTHVANLTEDAETTHASNQTKDTIATYTTDLMDCVFELQIEIDLSTDSRDETTYGASSPGRETDTEFDSDTTDTYTNKVADKGRRNTDYINIRVVDTDTGDEYTQVYNDAYIGAHVGDVREELIAVLTDIANCCFYTDGNAWIIPANPSHYDIYKGFEDNGNTLLWTQRIQAKPGDILFIYHTEPVAALACRCVVLESDIPTDSGDGFTAGSKLMRIQLIETYPMGKYPRSFLNEHGIKKTVRGQRSAPPELVLALLDE